MLAYVVEKKREETVLLRIVYLPGYGSVAKSPALDYYFKSEDADMRDSMKGLIESGHARAITLSDEHLKASIF